MVVEKEEVNSTKINPYIGGQEEGLLPQKKSVRLCSYCYYHLILAQSVYCVRSEFLVVLSQSSSKMYLSFLYNGLKLAIETLFYVSLMNVHCTCLSCTILKLFC